MTAAGRMIGVGVMMLACCWVVYVAGYIAYCAWDDRRRRRSR